MAKKETLDSTIVDKAIMFATKAHHNIERKGTTLPYIVHPIEAVAIVATITDDQDLLAAAALHDVIEDTGYTYEEIEQEFNKHVADLVATESDPVFEGLTRAESWRKRKEYAIARLKDASYEEKVVAMGDKLSNMRAILRDFNKLGDDLWDRFNVNDPLQHEWHYRSLLDALSDLKHTEAYQEFSYLVEYVFRRSNTHSFEARLDGNEIFVRGVINEENALKLEQIAKGDKFYYFDFTNAFTTNFGGIRTFIRMHQHGVKFAIRNAPQEIVDVFESTGASKFVSITRKPKEYLGKTEEAGEGYTAKTYNSDDNDSMIKVYNSFVSPKSVEKERTVAKNVFLMGVPTPMVGDIFENDGKYGITFEVVKNKKSIARAIADDPSKIDEYAALFAKTCKNLHSIECDKELFPDVKDIYAAEIDKSPFSENEKAKMQAVLDCIPNLSKCVHGDLHIGNVIINDRNEPLFIDLQDFAYGDPLFDIATFWFVTVRMNSQVAENMFHTSQENLVKFWNVFVREYFDISTPEEVEEKTNLIKKYAALKAVFFGNLHEYHPAMIESIKEYLLEEK